MILYYLVTKLYSTHTSRHYTVSLLDASVKLDSNSMYLFCRLTAISKEPDFSNAAQDKALRRLRELEYIE